MLELAIHAAKYVHNAMLVPRGSGLLKPGINLQQNDGLHKVV
jgi:hypothetical protein